MGLGLEFQMEMVGVMVGVMGRVRVGVANGEGWSCRWRGLEL